MSKNPKEPNPKSTGTMETDLLSLSMFQEADTFPIHLFMSHIHILKPNDGPVKWLR